MKKIKLYIAISLDGYISGKNGSIEWLNAFEGEGDNGFMALYSTIDTVVMGRHTYEWYIKQPSGFPYMQKQCYIMTSKEVFRTKPNLHFSSLPVKALAKQLRANATKDILIVGGAKIVKSFLDAKEIDEIILLVAPIILGEGVRLFEVGLSQSSWHLIQSKTYNQFVEMSFKKIDD